MKWPVLTVRTELHTLEWTGVSEAWMEEMPAGGPVEILHKIRICLSDTGEYLLYPLDFRKGNAVECLTANAQYVTKYLKMPIRKAVSCV